MRLFVYFKNEIRNVNDMHLYIFLKSNIYNPINLYAGIMFTEGKDCIHAFVPLSPIKSETFIL